MDRFSIRVSQAVWSPTSVAGVPDRPIAMPETSSFSRVAGRIAGLALVLAGASGCGAATALAPSSMLATAAAAEMPNAAEIRYVRETGAAVYRRAPTVERTRGFVFAGAASGYGICLRAPAKGGGFDHTLLVLQRRIVGSVSQVEDDAAILRRSADVTLCRDQADWVAAR